MYFLLNVTWLSDCAHACDALSVSPCLVVIVIVIVIAYYQWWNGFVDGNRVGFSSVTHSKKLTLKTGSL